MTVDPIQFQAALSLTELFDHYGTEKQCEQALEGARWPNGFKCKRCKGGVIVIDHTSIMLGYRQ